MEMRNMRGSVCPFIALILASSLFGACSKSPFSFLSGKDIVFTAETQVEETKVAYSGQTEGNFERIDWKDGDRIRIFSNKALTWKRDGSAGNPQATYVIKGNTVTADGRFSRANVSVVNSQDEGGLQWDETFDEHIFLALYPDQMPSGASSFVYGPAGNRFPCSFNTVQPHSQSGTSDMSYAYLFARTKVYRAQTREVKLSFYPLFTAFDFQLVDGENNNPTWNLKKLELISNKSICGKEKWQAMYQYDHLDWSYDDTAEGHNSFTLAHGESIMIILPFNKEVEITEENDIYTTTWTIGNEEGSTGNHRKMILTEDCNLIVDNHLDPVAPTNYQTNTVPYLLILLAGVLLLLLRKKRAEEKGGGSFE